MTNALPTAPAINVPGSGQPAGWRRQFAQPTGFLGRIAGHLMALRNTERSWWVLPLVDIHENDRVLEIGFGPGVDIRRVSEMALRGFVAGVDHSPVMVEQASKRNAAAIREGRVELRLGDVSHLPYPDASFDKVFSINVAPFWSEPLEAMREMRRVLRPGGLVAVAVQPRSADANERAAREALRSLVENLRAAGFSELRLESKRMKPASTVCALGVK